MLSCECWSPDLGMHDSHMQVKCSTERLQLNFEYFWEITRHQHGFSVLVTPLHGSWYPCASRTGCRKAEHVGRMGRVGIQVAMRTGMAGIDSYSE